MARAAAAKERSSTTLANIARPSKSGSFGDMQICNDGFHTFLFRNRAVRYMFVASARRCGHSFLRTLAMIANRYLPFAGRLLIGLPFAMSGLSKLAAYGATTGMISAVGLPFPPLAFAVAVAVELGGGVLLLAGYRVRFVATAMAVFALATAVSFHSNFADQNQMIHFLKNVMMAGGLLQITAFGAGAISLDNRRAKGGEAPANLALAGLR